MAKPARIRAALVFMSAELAKASEMAGGVVVTEWVVTDPRALVRGGNMNPAVAAGQPPPKHGVAPRSVLRGLGAGALTTSAGGVLAACTAGTKRTQASATGTINLGYPFEMNVVDNSLNKAVKIGANLEPTNA